MKDFIEVTPYINGPSAKVKVALEHIVLMEPRKGHTMLTLVTGREMLVCESVQTIEGKVYDPINYENETIGWYVDYMINDFGEVCLRIGCDCHYIEIPVDRHFNVLKTIDKEIKPLIQGIEKCRHQTRELYKSILNGDIPSKIQKK